MKRIIASVVCFALLLIFCACALDDDGGISSQTTDTSSADDASSASTSSYQTDTSDTSQQTSSLEDPSDGLTLEPPVSNLSDQQHSDPEISDEAESETESREESREEHQSSLDTTVDPESDDTQMQSSSFSEPSENSFESDITSTESEEPPVYDIGDAEVLPTGYLIYNGAAYSAARYSSVNCQKFADVYARYAELFPDTQISVVNHPLSIISVKNPLVTAMMQDQGEVLDAMESHIYGDVNFVNLKDIFTAHKGEYLYFKSDFHWTQLGAYYAYVEFANSLGLIPTPLNWFEKVTVTDSFVGRTYEYAQDERILSFVDTVFAYMPRREHTMRIYDSGFNLIREYDNCIRLNTKSYSCFTKGDQAYIEINVPKNDQDRTVLVIKESSANAFVPFLTEHYGNIIVIDPRMLVFDIKELVAERGVDDIIFFATASTSNGTAYRNYYKMLIGE